ncbi:hypothetical protein BD309DRAFT_972964 [Dichomitus squalens]|nr:hypothetical protein BD309DRAFT_972964 [Dichomitus squalens]
MSTNHRCFLILRRQLTRHAKDSDITPRYFHQVDTHSMSVVPRFRWTSSQRPADTWTPDTQSNAIPAPILRLLMICFDVAIGALLYVICEAIV